MAGLMDLLLASSQAPPPLPPDPNAADVSVTARPRGPVPRVSGITPSQNVSAAGLPSLDQGVSQTAPVSADQTAPPVGVNYNNSNDIQAIHNVLSANQPTPGGQSNAGVYGLLPQSLQHGTLRNVLGALGDAFLVGSGRQPQYQPRMERQAEGDTMAGVNYDDPASVQAGIQRLRATGAPEAMQMADQLEKNFNDLQLRKQLQEQNNWYRQSRIEDQRENTLTRWAPIAQADLSQATNAQDYAARKARWDQRINGLYPDKDNPMDSTTAFGVPSEYTAGALNSTSGMTNAQDTAHQDRQSAQATSRRDTDVNAGSRITAAGIGAASHVAAANVSNQRPSAALFMEQYNAKKARGEQTTPAEDAYAASILNHGSRGRGALAPGITVNGATTAPAATGGGPQAADVAFLKANPQYRAQFDAHFGAGASARVLGH